MPEGGEEKIVVKIGFNGEKTISIRFQKTIQIQQKQLPQ